MIIGQMIIGLFLFSVLMTFIGELIRKADIKKEYQKCNCKSILSIKEFTEKYYNRI